VAISLLLSVVALYLVWRYVQYFGARWNEERVVVLGAGVGARKLADVVEAADPVHSVVGFVSEESGPTSPRSRPILGKLSELKAITDSVQRSRIIVAFDNLGRSQWIHPLLECGASGIFIETSAQAYERLKGKLPIENMTPSYLLLSGLFCGAIRAKPRQEAIARVVSVAVAVVGLVIAAPLILTLAALIKLESPGPVLFVQDYSGLYGKAFKVLKFRTMKQASQGKASDGADRITWTGKWVFKLRLDELLQLVNILRGDMNLVGPRPQPVASYELFSKKIPYYHLRGTVRPGLTGWAQLRNGYADNLEEETERLRHDLYYIKNRSLWLDLGVILETLKGLLSLG
jgi:lipopolysaccharide/colanic/teichoic acid biosynthesis glycosyltransferase